MDIDTSAVPIGLENRIRIRVIPGATGRIVRRTNKSDPPIVSEIPPIKWNGRQYSRYDIANGTGISHSHICKIFNASRRPSLQMAMRLATFFQCSMDVLLTQVLPRIEIKPY